MMQPCDCQCLDVKLSSQLVPDRLSRIDETVASPLLCTYTGQDNRIRVLCM